VCITNCTRSTLLQKHPRYSRNGRGNFRIKSALSSADLYYQKIKYDGLDIEEIEYGNGCSMGLVKNIYGYDADHRLNSVTNKIYKPLMVEGRYNARYTYDAAGNIKSLQRHGVRGYEEEGTPIYGLIDDLRYMYDGGGRLTRVRNFPHASEDHGFPGFVSDYGYDSKGNMLSATNRELQIQYNPINLPRILSSDAGTEQIWYNSTVSKFKSRIELDDKVETRYYRIPAYALESSIPA